MREEVLQAEETTCYFYTVPVKQGFMDHLSERREGMSGTLSNQRHIFFLFHCYRLSQF